MNIYVGNLSYRVKEADLQQVMEDYGTVTSCKVIMDRAYLLFEGKILFQGTPEELAENKIVREKYLSNSFVLRRKDFQLKD